MGKEAEDLDAAGVHTSDAADASWSKPHDHSTRVTQTSKAGQDQPGESHPLTNLTSTAFVCIILAILSLIASFSKPESLLGVALFGGYAFHLYRGGRDFTGVMADGRSRSRAWLAWASIGGVALIAGFTWAPALAVAAAAGGYAAYLFTGGRDMTRESSTGMQRSVVWLYYATIAVLATIFGFTYAPSFIAATVAATYSVYLYRGGRWVLWIW
jgi:hypothetical protein